MHKIRQFTIQNSPALISIDITELRAYDDNTIFSDKFVEKIYDDSKQQMI